MSTVSDIYRTEAWFELGESLRLNRYYQGMLRRQSQYLILYRTVMVVLIFIALTLEFLESSIYAPEYSSEIVLFITVLLYFIENRIGISRKFDVLTNIVKECNCLSSEWREFWSEIETGVIDEKMARFKHTQLLRRRDASMSVAIEHIPNTNEKLNSKCTEESDMDLKNLKALYATSINP